MIPYYCILHLELSCVYRNDSEMFRHACFCKTLPLCSPGPLLNSCRTRSLGDTMHVMNELTLQVKRLSCTAHPKAPLEIVIIPGSRLETNDYYLKASTLYPAAAFTNLTSGGSSSIGFDFSSVLSCMAEALGLAASVISIASLAIQVR